jgi:hypothetical protein
MTDVRVHRDRVTTILKDYPVLRLGGAAKLLNEEVSKQVRTVECPAVRLERWPNEP